MGRGVEAQRSAWDENRGRGEGQKVEGERGKKWKGREGKSGRGEGKRERRKGKE